MIMKKIISAVLVCLMCVSFMSVAFAAGVSDYSYTLYDNNKAVRITNYKGTGTAVVVPEKINNIPVKSIGEGAFMYNEKITSVKLASGITTVSKNAFAYCKKLGTVTLSKATTWLGENAFYDCTALKTISNGDNIESIGACALDATAFLGNKTGVVYLGKALYKYRGTMPENYTLNIKSGTKSVSQNACTGLANLTKVVIPSSLTEIAPMAFLSCTSLKGIIVPATVVELGARCLGYNRVSSGGTYKFVPVDGFTIYTPKNSKAYTYAVNNKMTACQVSFGFGSTATVDENEKITLNATITSNNSTAKLTWSTSDKSVATVSANGVVTGVKAGTAVITCKTKEGLYSSKCTVTVQKVEQPVKLTVDKKATMSSDGKATKTVGTTKTTVVIPKIASVGFDISRYAYDGNVKTPAIVVMDSKGNELVSGTDFTVKYQSGRKNVGRYKVLVKFTGKYRGMKILTFKISPAGTKISSITPATGGFSVSWNENKAQTTGYQIQYSESKTFDSVNTVTVKNSVTSKNVTGLKSGTTYYVRVRTYKTVLFSDYHSLWSEVKTVKTK